MDMITGNSMLKLVYTFFLGILLALFVGLGINTFYPGPSEPQFPTVLNYNVSKEMTSEQIAVQKKYDAEMKVYNEKMKPYSRNVSIITLVAAVVFLVLSLVFETKLHTLADGIMFGGLFTLVYSIIRGFISQESKYVFIVVTIGLVTIIYLGYHKFIRHQALADQVITK